jgi:antirestriction protein ArdC
MAKAPFDTYKNVTDRIVAHLEEVQAAGENWDMPYVPVPAQMPVNLDGRAYTGVNWFLLSLMGSPSGLWGTYARWQEAGAQVRKGQRSTLIIFFKRYEPKESKEGGPAAEEGQTAAVIRYYTVFSAEQVENTDGTPFDVEAWQAKLGRARPEMPNGAERLDAAEAVLRRYHGASGVRFTEGDGFPCYIPSLDTVRMPEQAAFHTTAGYYSTWLHECAHSTGHKRRLDRDLSVRFKSEGYALEELTAELAAAMGCAALGISPDEPRRDHARYIASWIKALREDKRCIVSIARRAQEAVDFIMATGAENEEALAA